jgi:outer membrane biosynthesis protein TonB
MMSTVKQPVMRRVRRIALLITLAAALPALAGCADFDPDKLDIFNLNEKKKLPGDRKPVFPEGVPGVSQGIPPEFVQGNQPPPETAQSAIPPEPEKPAVKQAAVEKPKVKRKPKPRTATSAPTQPVQSQPDPAFDRPAPAAPQPAPAAQQPAPWPQAPATR